MESPKRKRARLACQPCRERKRKCDGRDPCVTCTEWGYECRYEARPKAAKTPTPATTHDPSDSSAGPHPLPFNPQPPTPVPSAAVPAPSAAASAQDGLRRRLEANSGAATVRRLGLKMDPARAPRLNLFGWNIGERQLSSAQTLAARRLPIVDITTLDHMKSLAGVYFEKLDPCYGFIDREQFFKRLESRWQPGQVLGVYDSVLGGVAAIGCIFSQRHATVTELHLVHTARSILDGHIFSGPASLDLLTGWLLRTIHLRLTDSPHATWMASCTLMHLIEALGLHAESEASLSPTTHCDPDLKRRIVGVAHHLNAWTSFDLGLSRVRFQKHDLPLPPAPKPGDYTGELLGLLPTSVSLDPSAAAGDGDLVATLATVLNGSHTQPPSVMAQTNLALCLVRRILSQNLDLAGLAEPVLALCRKALGGALTMLRDCAPWHQVANIPFHILCVILVMDTRPSLALLPDALHTLGLVAATYDTETMRETKSAAYLLVLLHQQRRKDDLAIFNKALAGSLPEPPVPVPAPPTSHCETSEDHAWLEALVADLPVLRDVDLEEFLNADLSGSSYFLGA